MVALPVLRCSPADWLSVALPRPADACYALFCQVERIPEWLAVIRSAVVQKRDRRGRARRVAFLARLAHATIGYTCTYRYHGEARRVAWSTPDDGSIRVQGCAQFQPLGDRSCLMTYVLDLDLGATGLETWADPVFDAHAASAALSDFRDFAIRTLV